MGFINAVRRIWWICGRRRGCSGGIPVKGDKDGLNVNVVVQVHSQLVKEEWKVPHKVIKIRPLNLEPLRFQKSDFHHNATLVSSPRLEAFLTDIGTIQGMQSAISRIQEHEAAQDGV